MRFILGFLVGVMLTGLLSDRGLNLPDRLGRLVNSSEVQQLGRDIGHAVSNR
jgi:hypothetical protein